MKYTTLLLVALLSATALSATETNATVKQTKESNITKPQKEECAAEKKKKIEAQIKEQMEREKKYAKEQKFYQGDEYDLKAHEVDPSTLPDVPVIEPDYDFDITDVYRDDI